MTRHDAPRSPLRVRKRDGQEESFDPAKLWHCIRQGLDAGADNGAFDRRRALDLAATVRHYLGLHPERIPVDSQHIAALVDLILRETGHESAAEAIERHARFRRECRRAVAVLARRPRDRKLTRRRWSKRRLVRSLGDRHELEPRVARMIAGRVELLVFNCGLNNVTSDLVAEMTRSELLAWGLHADALAVDERNSSCKPIREGP